MLQLFMKNALQEGAELVPEEESVEKTLSIIELISSGGTAGILIILLLFALLLNFEVFHLLRNFYLLFFQRKLVLTLFLFLI